MGTGRIYHETQLRLGSPGNIDFTSLFRDKLEIYDAVEAQLIRKIT